jgi:HD-GYP domain-containing protein (c-di-GMP phosphodiesterase class II)
MIAADETRLSEILAALSLACDLGNDFPIEKGLRNTLIAMQLGRKVGLDPAALTSIYYVGLLRFIGCSSYAHEASRVFPDDNAMRGAMAQVDFGYPIEGLKQAAKLGSGRLGRVRAVATMVTLGKRIGEGLQRADCEVMIRGANRMGLPPAVAKGLGDVYERWDGKGGPRGIAGEAIDPSARILAVAHEAEIHQRIGGRSAACAVIRRGAGGWFDPGMVRCFIEHSDELLASLALPSVWDLVLDEEPTPRMCVASSKVEDIARVFAELSDLKCSYTLGHSVGVAELAANAAGRMGLSQTEIAATHLGGLLHDLGHLSVPTAIWNKPAPLSRSEWERVRLHSYHAERVLSQSLVLAPAARIAAMHHERLDGTGYHRGVHAATISTPARVLAAADVYHALIEDRPHRRALSDAAAATELQRMVQAGALDRQAVQAVCETAGHRVRKRSSGWPAGLSDREVEVLRYLARGFSEKQIGKALFISAGTVHTHVAHIYEKIDASTRAGAALFAMENDLLRP